MSQGRQRNTDEPSREEGQTETSRQLTSLFLLLPCSPFLLIDRYMYKNQIVRLVGILGVPLDNCLDPATLAIVQATPGRYQSRTRTPHQLDRHRNHYPVQARHRTNSSLDHHHFRPGTAALLGRLSPLVQIANGGCRISKAVRKTHQPSSGGRLHG